MDLESTSGSASERQVALIGDQKFTVCVEINWAGSHRTISDRVDLHGDVEAVYKQYYTGKSVSMLLNFTITGRNQTREDLLPTIVIVWYAIDDAQGEFGHCGWWHPSTRAGIALQSTIATACHTRSRAFYQGKITFCTTLKTVIVPRYRYGEPKVSAKG